MEIVLTNKICKNKTHDVWNNNQFPPILIPKQSEYFNNMLLIYNFNQMYSLSQNSKIFNIFKCHLRLLFSFFFSTIVQLFYLNASSISNVHPFSSTPYLGSRVTLPALWMTAVREVREVGEQVEVKE